MLSRLGGGLAMACLLVAALGKLADVPAFAAELRRMPSVPIRAAEPLSLLVPALEFTIAGAYLMGLRRRLCLSAAMVLLVAMSVFLLRQVRQDPDASCACMGILERHRVARMSAREAVIRNAVLGGAVLAALVMPAAPARTARVGRLPPTGGCARGFTLIESLMVIAVVAILAALLTPKFHEVRRGAWRATSLSNLRLHAAVFGVYAYDFKDAFPYYVDPAAPVFEVGSRIRGVGYPTGYFGAAALWNYALADSYYEGDPFQLCFYPPDYPYGVRSPEWRYGPTPYVYSCTFLADPAFWNPATRTGPSQWRPTYAHEVRFTDSKVLLISEFTTPRDRDGDRPIPPPTNDRWEVATTAGAAIAVPAGRMNRGYRRGDGHWSVPGHVSAGTPGTHTVDGIHGRDWP